MENSSEQIGLGKLFVSLNVILVSVYAFGEFLDMFDAQDVASLTFQGVAILMFGAEVLLGAIFVVCLTLSRLKQICREKVSDVAQ